MADRQIEEIILKVTLQDQRAAQRLDELDESTEKVDKSTSKLSDTYNRLKNVIGALGLAKFAKESLKVAAEFDKTGKMVEVAVDDVVYQMTKGRFRKKENTIDE